RYAEQFTSPESELLKKINRDTHAEVLMPRMLSGHLQGRLLAMISCMIKPRTILEIGTYTGYSALCLAEGLAAGGKLITIDKNAELEERVRSYFSSSPYHHAIDYRIGNALDILPQLSGPFDLIFIDADKENYCNYYDFAMKLVPLNGFILADNVLWSGKVLHDKPDKVTRAVQAFNQKVKDDSRVEHVLLPVRDGLMLIRRVS
ncbi:MAG: class I SAM-dependent methyltransferase, partial [Cyclobacteriaceae bacterium]|nr:class I SAM-dependent methyltransferase [Cyclobacteriaceae bacterium]